MGFNKEEAFSINKDSLVKRLLADDFGDIVIVEDEKYKSFSCADGVIDNNCGFYKTEYSRGDYFNLLDYIHKLCPATYWKCIHIYIRGRDIVNVEKLCISNESMDIPYDDVNIVDVKNIFEIVFGKPAMYNDGVRIEYFKLVFKQFKTKPKSKRKGIPNHIRVKVFDRDNYTCQICGRTPKRDGVALHVDHIDPVVNGGSNDMSNLQTLCSDCNHGKGARLDLKCTREILGDDELW